MLSIERVSKAFGRCEGVALIPAVCGWLAGRLGVEAITLFLVSVAALLVGVNEWVSWLSGAGKQKRISREGTKARKL